MRAQGSSDKNEQYRKGVGIMLLNSRGDVFVARRADLAEKGWQMPQGGIDDSKDPREAALRELKEEIGTDNAEVIEESRDWFYYDFPEEIRERIHDGRWIGQRQKWFVMRFKGEDSEIDLRTSHPEFAYWKWVAVRALPSLVVSFKRQVYLDLLSGICDVGFRPGGAHRRARKAADRSIDDGGRRCSGTGPI